MNAPLIHRSIVRCCVTIADVLFFRYLLFVLMVLGVFVSQAGAGGAVTEGAQTSDKHIPEVLVYSEINNRDEAHQNRNAIVVEKSTQRLMVYTFDRNGAWRHVRTWPCSTGKKSGPKKQEGDQRTPEGVYFITRNVSGRFLTATYGSRALPLDYPNLSDRRRRLTGSAIWLHGTNRKLKPRDSNGCVVMRNKDIDRLSRMIRLRKTPVIIVDHIRWRSPGAMQKQAETVLSTIRKWHDALSGGSYRQFEKWYAKGTAPGMTWWNQWCRRRNRSGLGNGSFRSELSDRTVFGKSGVYVVLFNHYMRAGKHTVLVGRKKLFVQARGDRVHIIGDTYQWPSNGRYRLSEKDPLFSALKKIKMTVNDNHEQVTVEETTGSRT